MVKTEVTKDPRNRGKIKKAVISMRERKVFCDVLASTLFYPIHRRIQRDHDVVFFLRREFFYVLDMVFFNRE
jgi:hypothetical protein